MPGDRRRFAEPPRFIPEEEIAEKFNAKYLYLMGLHIPAGYRREIYYYPGQGIRFSVLMGMSEYSLEDRIGFVGPIDPPPRGPPRGVAIEDTEDFRRLEWSLPSMLEKIEEIRSRASGEGE